MKILVMIFLLIPSVCAAQIYLNIKNKDGTTHYFNVSDIKKISFEGIVSGTQGLEPDIVANSFLMLQNYPNPFNPSTTIEYQIPQSGNLEVMIFNSAGQLVKTLENQYKEGGVYRITWDSKNDKNESVASGVYLCQVKFRQENLIKKIMLIK